jgi:hypothetical protein
MAQLKIREKVSKTTKSPNTKLTASTKNVESNKKDIITDDDRYNMKVLGITDIRELRQVEKNVAEAEEDLKNGDYVVMRTDEDFDNWEKEILAK